MGAGITNHTNHKSCIQASWRWIPELTSPPPPSSAPEGTESRPSLEDHPQHQPLVTDPNPATSAPWLKPGPLHVQWCEILVGSCGRSRCILQGTLFVGFLEPAELTWLTPAGSLAVIFISWLPSWLLKQQG